MVRHGHLTAVHQVRKPGCYTAWPLYDVSVVVHAIETPTWICCAGKSITSQIVTAYTRRTGAHMSALAQSVAVQG
jgi:hypothetical protein